MRPWRSTSPTTAMSWRTAASSSRVRPRVCARTPISRSSISGSTRSAHASLTATSSTTAGASAGCRNSDDPSPASAGEGKTSASDDPFGAQRIDLAVAEAEPLAEDFGIVLAQQWRRLDARRRAIETDRPCRNRQFAGGRVLDLLHDPTSGERRIVQQFERVEHRTGRHTGRANDLHRLFLGVLAGPGGDDLVDLSGTLAARRPGVVARVANQILATDHL